MIIMIIMGDMYYRIEYGLTFIAFLFIILAIIYWGIANQHIEQYNHLLWCHTGDSFIVLSTAMANLFLILFIFTLPKRQDLYKYDLNKHYNSIMAGLSDIPTSIRSKTSVFTTDSSETLQNEQIEMTQIKDNKSVNDDTSSEVSLGATVTNVAESESMTNTNSIDEHTSLLKSNTKKNESVIDDVSDDSPSLGFKQDSNVVSVNDVEMKPLIQNDLKQSTETSEM